MDLFDLAMVDTLRAYPRLSIQPFRDMIAGETHAYIVEITTKRQIFHFFETYLTEVNFFQLF